MSETVKATLSPGLIYEYHDVDFRGSIERVTYTTTNPQGEPRKKYANVYLPYGYNSIASTITIPQIEPMKKAPTGLTASHPAVMPTRPAKAAL